MSDPFLTLAQIAATIPGARGAKQLSAATLTRWILAGSPSRAGGRVRLIATRCGGRWLVRQSDLDQFFRECAGEIDPTPPTDTPTDAANRKAAERANRELEQAGC
jgi:hypothetical protein